MAIRKKASKRTRKPGKPRKKSASSGKSGRAARKKSAKRAGQSATRRRRTPEKRPVSGTPEVFEALAAVLAPYAHLFVTEMNSHLGYCLKAQGPESGEIYFAGVQWSEGGVFFHLPSVLRHPHVLDGIGAELRARREGGSSFRFERVEPELFAELAALAGTTFECLRHEGILGPAA